MAAGEVNKQRGFTLIELLVTLMIATIIAVMAVPAFAGFLARQQLASDVNEIISVLSFARSEAIKQRRDISIVFSPPNTTTTSRRPESCRNNESVSEGSGETLYTYSGWCYEIEHGGKVMRIGQVARLTAPENKFTIIFQSLGDAALQGCTFPCEITISSERDGIIPVTLAINITGSIRRKESVL